MFKLGFMSYQITKNRTNIALKNPLFNSQEVYEGQGQKWKDSLG